MKVRNLKITGASAIVFRMQKSDKGFTIVLILINGLLISIAKR